MRSILNQLARPPSAAVWGEDLVDEQQLVGRLAIGSDREAELELGVGEHEALLRADPTRGGEDRERSVAKGAHQRFAHDFARALERDVFVVAFRGLGGGGEDRLRNLPAPREAFRELDAADRAGNPYRYK